MKRILDLSDTAEWTATAKQVAESAVPAAMREVIERLDPDQMYSDTLSYIVNSAERMGQFLPVDEWNRRLSRRFQRKYSLIRAFHACRPIAGNVETYKRDGLLRMSKSLLRRLALNAFSAYADRGVILSTLESQKIPICARRVYLFTDQTHAVDSSQNHYLQCGSEYLQGLAIALGLGKRGILNAQGHPCLIECHVPLGIVSKSFLNELWRLIITNHFQAAAGRRAAAKPPDFCIQVVRNIPPACIKGFIMLDDGRLKYSNPNH